jgi:hypothetical protein
MHTTKVDPDLVDITRYNKFSLELFWGLERDIPHTGMCRAMGFIVYIGMVFGAVISPIF